MGSRSEFSAQTLSVLAVLCEQGGRLAGAGADGPARAAIGSALAGAVGGGGIG